MLSALFNSYCDPNPKRKDSIKSRRRDSTVSNVSTHSTGSRGEREPRSFSVAWTVAPTEWMTSERLERRQRCFGKSHYQF